MTHGWAVAPDYYNSYFCVTHVDEAQQAVRVRPRGQDRLSLQRVPDLAQLHGLRWYASAYTAKEHDNLIGFVTKLDQPLPQVERLEGISRYGTLMRIHKQSFSDFMMNDKVRVTKMNVVGITFARFRVLSAVKRDIYYLADVEILNDEPSKDFEHSKRKLVEKLKQEMKLYLDCTLHQPDAIAKKQRLDLERSLNKIVFGTISQLDLPLADKLAFLQLNDHETRITVLTSHLSAKTENLKGISELEEKVRKDLQPPSRPQTTSFGHGGAGGKKTNEIDRIRQQMDEKNIPEYVREEMEK